MSIVSSRILVALILLTMATASFAGRYVLQSGYPTGGSWEQSYHEDTTRVLAAGSIQGSYQAAGEPTRVSTSFQNTIDQYSAGSPYVAPGQSTVKIGGTITYKFQWEPSSSNDPPPKHVIKHTNAYAGATSSRSSYPGSALVEATWANPQGPQTTMLRNAPVISHSGNLDEYVYAAGTETITITVTATATATGYLGVAAFGLYSPDNYISTNLRVDIYIIPIGVELTGTIKNYKGTAMDATSVGAGVGLQVKGAHLGWKIIAPEDAHAFINYTISDTSAKLTKLDPQGEHISKIYFTRPGQYTLELKYGLSGSTTSDDHSFYIPITVEGPSHTLVNDRKTSSTKGVDDIEVVGITATKTDPNDRNSPKRTVLEHLPRKGGGKRLYLAVKDPPIIKDLNLDAGNSNVNSGTAMIVQTAKLAYAAKDIDDHVFTDEELDLRNNVWGLDGTVPYGRGMDPQAPAGLTMITRDDVANDSRLEFRDTPAIVLFDPSITGYMRKKEATLAGEFKIHVLYSPSLTGNGKYVPILVQPWQISGKAVYKGSGDGAFAYNLSYPSPNLPNSSHNGSLSISFTHPVWDKQVNGF